MSRRVGVKRFQTAVAKALGINFTPQTIAAE
jgi:hypothetical protein